LMIFMEFFSTLGFNLFLDFYYLLEAFSLLVDLLSTGTKKTKEKKGKYEKRWGYPSFFVNIVIFLKFYVSIIR